MNESREAGKAPAMIPGDDDCHCNTVDGVGFLSHGRAGFNVQGHRPTWSKDLGCRKVPHIHDFDVLPSFIGPQAPDLFV